MDIAVLKMETKDKFKPVKFGDSDKARVGDWVVAIGNPFGLGGTVTSGIISARNRDINLTRSGTNQLNIDGNGVSVRTIPTNANSTNYLLFTKSF